MNRSIFCMTVLISAIIYLILFGSVERAPSAQAPSLIPGRMVYAIEGYRMRCAVINSHYPGPTAISCHTPDGMGEWSYAGDWRRVEVR